MVFFDALRVKIRDEGMVRNKAVYVALALNPDGEKEVLGLWIEQTEGAKFWLKVVNELKTRGLNDILIAVVDGLKGFPEAIASVYPQTVVQTCIVHLIRNSLAFVAWKDRKAILPAIKAIYRAENADMALVRLEEFEDEWGKRYPAIGQAWRRAWEHVVPEKLQPACCVCRQKLLQHQPAKQLRQNTHRLLSNRRKKLVDRAGVVDQRILTGAQADIRIGVFHDLQYRQGRVHADAPSADDAFVAHLRKRGERSLPEDLILLLPAVREEGEVRRYVVHKRDV